MCRGAGMVVVVEAMREGGGKEMCRTLPRLSHHPVVVWAREEGKKLCRYMERQGG